MYWTFSTTVFADSGALRETMIRPRKAHGQTCSSGARRILYIMTSTMGPRLEAETTTILRQANSVALCGGGLVPGEADQDQVLEVSYTGVARVDGTDGEAASADLLEQSMDAMTLAIHDGSFLTKLQASDPGDLCRGRRRRRDASGDRGGVIYVLAVLTPGPSAAPTPRTTVSASPKARSSRPRTPAPAAPALAPPWRPTTSY